ncbi:M42 family peptidase [Methanosalsum natronophilum]|uniref:M42 family peptidase n=1 Tax=Methanosalsum natronophilum TaxID=768733 RepID=A0A3R7X7I9_9EURY|nr:MAG: M42 family peptidase [Methanosalsum natronophilum]
MKHTEELLEKLSNAHGISGFEGNIRKIFEDELTPYVDSITTDKMGNIVATKKGSGPSVMIAAHMDEIGLMVKYIDENGFLRFVKIGGWFDPTIHSQRVIIHSKKGEIKGVIGSKPPHVMKEEDRKKPPKAEDMFIDIGVTTKEEAEGLGVEVGSPISLDRHYSKLANNIVTGKALDDRVGLVILIQVLKELYTKNIGLTIHGVGTVQEEVGLKGARVAAFGLNPDIALITETTIAGDYPGIDKKDSAIEVGKGSAITIVDAAGRGLIANQKIIEWLRTTADENNINYQMDVADGGTTDATAIHITKEGIPSGVLSIPTRYIHSPVEVLSLDDIDSCIDLILKSFDNIEKFF